MWKRKVIPKSPEQPESKTIIHKTQKHQPSSLHQIKQLHTSMIKSPENAFSQQRKFSLKHVGENRQAYDKCIVYKWSVYKSINQVNHLNPFAHIKTLKQMKFKAQQDCTFISSKAPKAGYCCAGKTSKLHRRYWHLLGMEIFDSFFREQRQSP
jgi:hypothetical protein